jgi:phage shock protein A
VNNNVSELDLRRKQDEIEQIQERRARGPQPPDNDNMEARVAALETDMKDVRDRLVKIEAKLDATATKADLHQELHSLSWRLATLCAALAAGVYWIATHVHP